MDARVLDLEAYRARRKAEAAMPRELGTLTCGACSARGTIGVMSNGGDPSGLPCPVCGSSRTHYEAFGAIDARG